MSEAVKDKSQPTPDEAISWETERVVSLRKAARNAWYVAGIACICALLAIAAIFGLTPLKQTIPYVIRVNQTTGIVDVVNTLQDSKTTYGKAVTRYFAAKYIRARESYSRALAATRYKEVGLMSGHDVTREYYKAFSPKNPKSPLKVYRENAKVKAQIRSISFLSPHLLSIRFIKTVKWDNRQPDTYHRIATVKFRYSGAPMHAADRLINPLGFQVIDYSVADEVPND